MLLRAPKATDDNEAPNCTPANGARSTCQDNRNTKEGGSILPVCRKIAEKVNTFLATPQETPALKQLQEQTRIALGVISTALERYTPEELSLSYNGGKDCLVLLILLLAALSNSNHAQNLPPALQSVYIVSPDPFAEVDEFVDESIDAYRLDLARHATPMKEAFTRYLAENKSVKAILVGTRRTDPHGAVLGHFDKTDHGWPAFMRVHPIIDWHYADIWAFILHFQVPYCVLYDQGYTSLGGTTDTHPNPALKADSESGDGKGKGFRPAYELIKDESERLGRDW